MVVGERCDSGDEYVYAEPEGYVDGGCVCMYAFASISLTQLTRHPHTCARAYTLVMVR